MEEGYLKCVTYTLQTVFCREDDGHCYVNENGKFVCGIKHLRPYPHLPQCPERSELDRRCVATEGDPHQHQAPTPREWIETLLYWKAGCTQYANHHWTTQETLEYVYEIWPFEMDYNPRYLEKKLRYNLGIAAGYGFDRSDQKWDRMFNIHANLACEDFIDRLFLGRSYWNANQIRKWRSRLPMGLKVISKSPISFETRWGDGQSALLHVVVWCRMLLQNHGR